ncbi:flagellar basal body rod protein FlgC [Bythopirellula polymerisocia]|uniref:Flagellar basal-body rod protein FlgC n=1 Tax=Bythopirellula polymerisocia TaxID=2528003 RepID=A0A5C6CXN2_9BACT|nr:flagellar basal body rod protein FlgC [Bythopirellula polymerisocia]TWU27796.1 Flagellar basal-body rod protein FlgC [Bythopirellula polymerisocia]
MFNALDVSTSGLVAQRTRLNAISSNLANMSTTRNEAGEAVPYTPRFVVFKTDDNIVTSGGGQGVTVDRVDYADVEPNMKYEPGHPDANAEGYVAYPNIDMTTEFVDALGASRAYEANIGVIEVTKDMVERTLQILA